MAGEIGKMLLPLLNPELQSKYTISLKKWSVADLSPWIQFFLKDISIWQLALKLLQKNYKQTTRLQPWMKWKKLQTEPAQLILHATIAVFKNFSFPLGSWIKMRTSLKDTNLQQIILNKEPCYHELYTKQLSDLLFNEFLSRNLQWMMVVMIWIRYYLLTEDLSILSLRMIRLFTPKGLITALFIIYKTEFILLIMDDLASYHFHATFMPLFYA